MFRIMEIRARIRMHTDALEAEFCHNNGVIDPS